MSLAIVIPYYKIDFFEKTLKSLYNQTNQNFKIYIGDDASKNSPKKIIDKFSFLYPVNYVRFDTNLGSKSLASQWNRCVELSENEKWLLLLCDDDLLDNSCVSEFYTCVDEIEKNNIDVVRFATDIIDENDLKLNEVVSHPKIEKSTDFLIRRLSGGTRNSISENIFKTNVVKNIKFKNFPLAWHSDDLALLEFSNFDNLFTINNAKVYFRLSSVNITNNKNNFIDKNKASFMFYNYLIRYKSNYFTPNQKNIIIEKLEKRILEDKKNIKNWMLIIHLYLCNFYLKNLLLLFVKTLKRILN
jgi:glycosyltransferase involved in cell wall biosynthesis